MAGAARGGSSSTTVTLPLGQTRGAFRPDTLNPATREVEVVWTTGARVRREGWEGPWLEELSLDEGAVDLARLNSGANLLAGHSAWGLKGIIGVVESAWIAPRADGRREGRARLRLSGEEEDAPVIRKIQDGIIRHVSVGYITHRLEEVEPGDRRARQPPVFRAMQWEPVEISFCAVPADAGAGVRSEGDGAGAYPCLVTRRGNMSDPTAVDERRPKAKPIRTRAVEERPPGAPPDDDDNGNDDDADKTPPPAPGEKPPEGELKADADDAARATVAERDRIARITHAVRAANLPPAFADQYITSGASELEAQRAVFAELARTQPPVARSVVEVVSGHAAARMSDGIVEALLHRIDPRRPLTDLGKSWRGMTLREIGRECLEARGIRTRGMAPLELAAWALGLPARHDMHVVTREGPHGFMTTSDFPLLLATVGRAQLTAGYTAAEKTFPPWTRQGTLPDFRPTNRVALGMTSKFLKVQEHGEYLRGRLTETAMTAMKLDKFGRILAYTREAMINDDLGMFNRIPQLFGNAAAQLESDIVYGVLTSNPIMADTFALFSTQHGNLMTASVIDVKNVALARSAMMNQKSPDGQYLSIVPRFMIVGPAQEVYALQFLAPLTIVGAVSGVVPAAYQSLKLIVDPRITDNAWYLAASPDQIDTIEYDYLEGSGEGPTLETREGWDIDGQEYKAREEFAAAAIDYRGLVKNPGTLPAILLAEGQTAPTAPAAAPRSNKSES
jgi:hypothetical protein